MKKLVAITAVALFAAASDAMSLAEASGKIDKVIADSSEMAEVMKQLPQADRQSFVAKVNEAIGQLGSAEDKSAAVIKVARGALEGIPKTDSKDFEAVVSEIFATAPLESLCALNEDLSKDVFNRAADPAKTYTDDQYADIASNLVSAVSSRVAGLDDADVRSGFAALMMIRGSNGTPASLSDGLAGMLGEEGSKVAKNEWFPEALKEQPNYDPMLSGTMVERYPDTRAVAAIAGAQRHQVLLYALMSDSEDPLGSIGKDIGDVSKIENFDHDLHTRPRTLKDLPWNPDQGATDDPTPPPYYGQSYN